MRKGSPLEIQLFASPAYLARRGAPRVLSDLAKHDIVAFQGFRARAASLAAGANARIVGDDFSFVREAVKAGAGIALLPSFLTQQEVAAGQLVRVLPRYAETGGPLVLLPPRAKLIPRKASAFRDFLLEYLAARPLPAAGS